MDEFIKRLQMALIIANISHTGIELRPDEVPNLMHYLGDVDGIIEQSSMIEQELRSREQELSIAWQLEHTERITLEERVKHLEGTIKILKEPEEGLVDSTNQQRKVRDE